MPVFKLRQIVSDGVGSAEAPASHEDHEHQYVCEMCKDTKVFKTKEVGGVWIVSFTGPEPSHQKQALVATTLHLHRARVTAVERGES